MRDFRPIIKITHNLDTEVFIKGGDNVIEEKELCVLSISQEKKRY